MYHREHPSTPSQHATNGALSIFVEGHRTGNARTMLFGLSVLRSATVDQVLAALPIVAASQHLTLAAIEAMLAPSTA